MQIMKPSIPKGTRDFSPIEVARRTYIFDTIKRVFQKYGYQPIETPVMENLSTLTGKYGEEGDQLIFKVLNSGDFLSKVDAQKLEAKNSKSVTFDISEKALRYDLTVPFARYVVMHQNEIAMPFKRYQVQPVWRADRPQKGRYREFYQCDADVVGSESLLNEAEFVCIYDEALSNLGLQDFSIKINNRKILTGIAEIIGKPELIVDMTVAIDKLDKIGYDGVVKELIERGFTESDVEVLRPFIELKGSNEEKLAVLKQSLANSPTGKKGIEELETIFSYLTSFKLNKATVELDITLARGLNYYTGAIFEVKSNEVQMGSIGGGGRYDDLTGMFGLKGVTGAGISFGADRIYDVMLELNLFPESAVTSTKVLLTNFDAAAEKYALPILVQLRTNDINTELYPASAKLQKQMKYADAKQIPFVVLIGEEEMQSGKLTLKNMQSGEQEKLSVEEIIKKLK
ncbi:histidine--tRNA ligase [Solitalea canadensis]|nr:histidine--tRNA ligase [Solitalea canadensis]